jgi:phage baseplate assembly protein V
MADLNNMIRRAKMTLQTVGLVLKYKINVYEGNAPEDAERHQNYGTASQPAEGEGLIVDVGGTVMVLSVDSIKDRPTLANWDVAVWHKEGHKVHLKAGKVVDIDCATLNINATSGVVFNTPSVTASGSITAAADVTAGGKSLMSHTHHENDNQGNTGTPN